MEKTNPNINIGAAFSFLTIGSVEPTTSQNNPSTGACSFEMPISNASQSGLKYICAAMLFHKGPFKFYKACRFNGDGCPLNQYTPSEIIVDEPLKIEKMWAEINANGK